ncbi:MAG: hypothetical protein AAGA56_13025, partial [Myxococcota bacterium]
MKEDDENLERLVAIEIVLSFDFGGVLQRAELVAPGMFLAVAEAERGAPLPPDEERDLRRAVVAQALGG